MNHIALPDLHNRTAEILAEIRQGREEYIVTDEGRPIARLSPVAIEAPREASVTREEEAWTCYVEAVEEAHQAQPEAWRTQDLLDEVRRT